MLDLATVVKAAQAISEEIALDALLKKLIELVVAHTEAQYAVLLLEQDGELRVEAEYSTLHNTITVLQSLPLEARPHLAPDIIQRVRDTGECLVAADAKKAPLLANIPFFTRRKQETMLCAPILSRGHLIGILYLEYSRDVTAFDTNTTDLLQTLLSHAAISLENARLYESMKREISDRKRAEEALRSITAGTAAATGGDFFRSLVRHLAAAFQVRYALVAECIDVTRTRVRTLAFLQDDHFIENIEYNTTGTPCHKVIGGQVCYYPERLWEYFPDDGGGGKESYLGSPLTDAVGNIVGHLAVLDDQPMQREPYDMSILRIFAARAGAELERQRAEEALRHSESLLQRFLDHSPAASYLKDTSGRYMLINQYAASLMGGDRDQIIGKTDADIFPDEWTSSWESNDKHALESGKPVEAEETLPHEDGLHTYISIKFPLHDDQGAIYAVGGVSTDITARKRAEEALRHREEDLRRLNEQLEDYNRNLECKVAERTREIQQRRQVSAHLRDVLTILNSNRSLDEILAFLVNEATWLLGTQSGAIYRLESNQQEFVVQAAQGLPEAYTENLRFPVARSFLGQAVLERKPVVISNLATAIWDTHIVLDDQRRGLLSTYQTLLAVPLIRQGESEEFHEIYGGIALYYEEAREFGDEEMSLAVAFADQATLAIENARLRQRVKQAAVLEERGRLSRELHDSVTQSLYSLTLLAEGWRRLARSGRLEDVTEPLAELGGIAQQALKEMRLLVHELRPPALEREGLLGALHERLAAVERRAGVDARLLADDIVELPAHIEEGLYRIAQEALNNALKHAQSTAVTVRIFATNGSTDMQVTDNGKGIDLATIEDQGGVGLVSMRERAEKLGGSLTIEASPGQGTCVKVCLPLATLPST